MIFNMVGASGKKPFIPQYTGKAKLVLLGNGDSGYMEFYTSGTLTWLDDKVPRFVDMFCVGGGGGGSGGVTDPQLLCRSRRGRRVYDNGSVRPAPAGSRNHNRRRGRGECPQQQLHGDEQGRRRGYHLHRGHLRRRRRKRRSRRVELSRRRRGKRGWNRQRKFFQRGKKRRQQWRRRRQRVPLCRQRPGHPYHRPVGAHPRRRRFRRGRFEFHSRRSFGF
jgi:hypothetical protein